jgi:hypothetical protein
LSEAAAAAATTDRPMATSSIVEVSTLQCYGCIPCAGVHLYQL